MVLCESYVINNQDCAVLKGLLFIYHPYFLLHLRVEENGVYLLLHWLVLWLGSLAALGLMFLLKESDQMCSASSFPWGFPRVFPSEEPNLWLLKSLRDVDHLLVWLFHELA